MAGPKVSESFPDLYAAIDGIQNEAVKRDLHRYLRLANASHLGKNNLLAARRLVGIGSSGIHLRSSLTAKSATALVRAVITGLCAQTH